MDINRAIYIAELWEGGKMIGGDEDDVRNSLLGEVKRLTAQNKELHENMIRIIENAAMQPVQLVEKG